MYGDFCKMEQRFGRKLVVSVGIPHFSINFSQDDTVWGGCRNTWKVQPYSSIIALSSPWTANCDRQSLDINSCYTRVSYVAEKFKICIAI